RPAAQPRRARPEDGAAGRRRHGRHLGPRGARVQGRPVTHRVAVERDVSVAMRDGVRLATDVYLPEGDGPFPTLLTRVRGSRSSGFIVAVLLLNPLEAVRRGYAVAVQE